MKVNTFEQKLLIELIPEDIRKKIATLPVVESGYGAGSGFAAVQRWTHDPPTTFLDALDELEHYRERLRRCHIVFLDGSRLVMDRHQFHSFHPSVRMRRKHAARIGQDGIIRERFRFSDYEEWSETLAGDIKVFRQVHTIAPNLLAASREVYLAIDEAAQSEREMVVNENGEHPSLDERFEISGFLIDGLEVEFVLTETTIAPEYMLIFDPDPSFDGEPFIIPGTNIMTRIKIAG
jgi:hypothetical protein